MIDDKLYDVRCESKGWAHPQKDQGTPCTFVLAMYDDYNQPVNQGGLMHNLTLGLSALSAPMLDNRDGTFTPAAEIGTPFGGTANTDYRYTTFMITDFDNNGRTDFLAIGDAAPSDSSNPLDLWWFGRVAGPTAFAQRLIDSNLDTHMFTAAADVDGDEDIDLVRMHRTPANGTGNVISAELMSYLNAGTIASTGGWALRRALWELAAARGRGDVEGAKALAFSRALRSTASGPLPATGWAELVHCGCLDQGHVVSPVSREAPRSVISLEGARARREAPLERSSRVAHERWSSRCLEEWRCWSPLNGVEDRSKHSIRVEARATPHVRVPPRYRRLAPGLGGRRLRDAPGRERSARRGPGDDERARGDADGSGDGRDGVPRALRALEAGL